MPRILLSSFRGFLFAFGKWAVKLAVRVYLNPYSRTEINSELVYPQFFFIQSLQPFRFTSNGEQTPDDTDMGAQASSFWFLKTSKVLHSFSVFQLPLPELAYVPKEKEPKYSSHHLSVFQSICIFTYLIFLFN